MNIFFVVFFHIFSSFLFSNTLNILGFWEWLIPSSLQAFTAELLSFLHVYSYWCKLRNLWDFLKVKVFKGSSILPFGDIIQFYLENQVYFMRSLWVLLEMTVCSIVPLLLIIEELETKLLSILQDLQCTNRSNSKWVGEAFSQRQGDWMLVCRWVKMKFEVKNEEWKQIYWWLWKGRFFFSNCEGHFTSVFICLLCTEGMSKEAFLLHHCEICNFSWIDFVPWMSYYPMKLPFPSFLSSTFCSHLTDQENYSCCIVWCCV